MNVQNVNHVLDVMRRFIGEDGWGTATRSQIAIQAGVSENTVKRAIQIIANGDALIVDTKKGHNGGYIFADPKRVKRASETGQTGQPNGPADEPMPCLSQTDQAPSGTGLVRLDATQTGQQTDQTGQQAENATEPKWFVCCVWYDEKGEMWCHGQDGYETYIPCQSKEAAMELAEEHRKMPHRGRYNDPPSWPNVDVCEQLYKGKQLHYRYDALGGGR